MDVNSLDQALHPLAVGLCGLGCSMYISQKPLTVTLKLLLAFTSWVRDWSSEETCCVFREGGGNL